DQLLLTSNRQYKIEIDSLLKIFFRIQKTIEECRKNAETVYEEETELCIKRRNEFEMARKDLIVFRYEVFTHANELYDSSIGKETSKKSGSTNSAHFDLTIAEVPDNVISNESLYQHQVKFIPPSYSFEDKNYNPTPFDPLEINHSKRVSQLNINSAAMSYRTSNRKLLLEEPLTTTLPDFIRRKRASSTPPNLKLPPTPPKSDEELENFNYEERGRPRTSMLSTASTVTPRKVRMTRISSSLPSTLPPLLPLPELPSIMLFEASPLLETDRLLRMSGSASAPPLLRKDGFTLLGRARSPVPNFPLPSPPSPSSQQSLETTSSYLGKSFSPCESLDSRVTNDDLPLKVKSVVTVPNDNLPTPSLGAEEAATATGFEANLANRRCSIFSNNCWALATSASLAWPEDDELYFGTHRLGRGIAYTSPSACTGIGEGGASESKVSVDARRAITGDDCMCAFPNVDRSRCTGISSSADGSCCIDGDDDVGIVNGLIVCSDPVVLPFIVEKSGSNGNVAMALLTTKVRNALSFDRARSKVFRYLRTAALRSLSKVLFAASCGDRTVGRGGRELRLF
ncbi:hypothetical protein HK096_006124, partial [Nowakowskiella sp. JEL0078]